MGPLGHLEVRLTEVGQPAGGPQRLVRQPRDAVVPRVHLLPLTLVVDAHLAERRRFVRRRRERAAQRSIRRERGAPLAPGVARLGEEVGREEDELAAQPEALVQIVVPVEGGEPEW